MSHKNGCARTLGCALATTLVLSGLAIFICWMRADLSPTLNGCDLELAFAHGPESPLL